MNLFLEQLILAAQRRGTEEWMNILFVVVIALFYIVGNLFKGKSGKFAKRFEKYTKQLGEKPAPRPTEEEETPWETLKRSLRQTQPEQPVKRKPQIHPSWHQATAKKHIRSEPAAKTTQQAGIPAPQVQPQFEQISEIPSTPVQSPTEKHAPAPAQTTTAKFLSDITSDYSNPASLRRAILHYEILGKPVSLRDPLEH